MSNVAKLKKKAAEFEQKKQFDKALAIYIQILDGHEPGDSDVDVGLYNRVGDLLLRQGTVADAVNYYEKAVDLYAEGGFFNNAIALCNKILRQSPGRNSIYYKLGKISAKKGFKSDAKQNFLEYADRMQKGGQLDEAFRALKEFADLCPDQDDIRLMLAEQLTKRERKTEAMEQLHLLYEHFDGQGRDTEARATLDRMKSIDPDAQPRQASVPGKSAKSSELVFLDVDFDEAPSRPKAPPRPTVKLPSALGEEFGRPAGRPPVSDLPLIDVGTADRTSGDFAAQADGDVPDGGDLPLLDAPMPAAQFGAIDLGTPADLRAVERNAHDLALPGDLPMIEVSSESPALDLMVVADDADDILDLGGGALDGLVPPIARPTTEHVAIDTISALDIEHTAAPAGLDASSLLAPAEFTIEPTTLADAGEAAGEFRLDGIEDTALDDESPQGGDLTFILTGDATDGGGPDAYDGGLDDGDLLLIGDDADDVDDANAADHADDRAPAPDFELPMLDALDEAEPAAPPPARATRVLTPAELAIVDAAARGDAPPTPDAVDALDDDAAEDLVDAGDAFVDAADRLVPLDATTPDDMVALPAWSATPARPAIAVASAPPSAADALAALAAAVQASPDAAATRREYAEALLAGGERDMGLAELELAMIGFERVADLESARGVADSVIRVEPNSVRHHQKRVEYAFRTNDRPRLVEAYLELGDALFRTGQADKARVIYQRILDLAPDNARARAASEAIGEPVDVPVAPRRDTRQGAPVAAQPSRRYTGDAARMATPSPVAPVSSDADFINLGDLLRADDAPKNTRMVVEEQAPTGDEQADFADMLKKFKQGVAANVDEEDYDSHYDLGVAFKEMGLVDEAIAEFQKALRAPARRVRTYEALGQCFLEKKQWQVASTILQRALAEPDQGDERLVGVLYLLGYAAEALHRPDDALEFYQRVFAVDIQFRDVVDRLSAVEKAAR